MLFNSYTFIFLFLPAVLVLFHALRRWGRGSAVLLCLLLASLLFYGYWNPLYLLLLIPSMLGNYLIGQQIMRSPEQSGRWLILGISANLALLGWFKYRNFLLESLQGVVLPETVLPPLILPLAISFFTFQQIAYLVDLKKGRVESGSLFQYMTFVAFFPQLIAGPIVHYQQVSGQFSAVNKRNFDADLFATGVALFSLGLFKKVVLADSLAPYVSGIFGQASAGEAISSVEAWQAAFGYSFQLYFDFSGYADMALGLAAMFGIRLPINFNSPYKARSIVEFWQRWHITLSHFLRDYLYIPLGGSRNGAGRRSANLMVTMLLGGLWHGAGWTFVLWGAVHGLLLTLTHLVRSLLGGRTLLPAPLAVVMTFVLVTLAWVLFRADSLAAAQQIYRAMFEFDALSTVPEAMVSLVSHPDGPFWWLMGAGAMTLLAVRPARVVTTAQESPLSGRLRGVIQAWLASAEWRVLLIVLVALTQWPVVFSTGAAGLPLQLMLCAAIVWLLPNSQQWLGYQSEAASTGSAPRVMRSALAAGALLFISLNRMLGQPATEFLYFNF